MRCNQLCAITGFTCNQGEHEGMNIMDNNHVFKSFHEIQVDMCHEQSLDCMANYIGKSNTIVIKWRLLQKKQSLKM